MEIVVNPLRESHIRCCFRSNNYLIKMPTMISSNDQIFDS